MRKIHCSPLAFQQERNGHASETARSVSGAAGISAQLLQQAGEPGVGARIDLRLQAVKDMGAPFGKVGDARRRAFGMEADADRKSVVQGKSVSVRVALGGRRSIKKTI